MTVEVTAEGAQKIALARNVGTLSLSLRSSERRRLAAERRHDDLLLRRFGRRQAQGAAAIAGRGGRREPEGPKFKTVIVTRGTAAAGYQVVSPDNTNKRAANRGRGARDHGTRHLVGRIEWRDRRRSARG